MTGDQILCCEEDICGGEAVKRLAVSLDNGHVHVLRQEMWRTSKVAAATISKHAIVPTGVWETDPEAGIVIGADHLPSLINALLRLCTPAQLGEVVKVRVERAVELMRERCAQAAADAFRQRDEMSPKEIAAVIRNVTLKDPTDVND